jgi:hypothetical protein
MIVPSTFSCIVFVGFPLRTTIAVPTDIGERFIGQLSRRAGVEQRFLPEFVGAANIEEEKPGTDPILGNRIPCLSGVR